MIKSSNIHYIEEEDQENDLTIKKEKSNQDFNSKKNNSGIINLESDDEEGEVVSKSVNA